MATNSRKGFELHEILRGGILRKFHTSRRFSRRRVVRNWSAGRPVSAVTDGVSTNLLAYDPIGNRTESAVYDENGTRYASVYETNGRNQYVSRTVPGLAAARGYADARATVTVNGNPAFRLGGYFFGTEAFDNTESGVDAEVETYAALPSDEEGGDDLVAAVTNRVHVPQSPEIFAYDANGNQTIVETPSGRWAVEWNAENRPVRWACGNRTLLMAYDHMGRRVRCVEITGGITNRVATFLYDGYLCIARTENGRTDRFLWDPTEPVATRPLATVADGTAYLYAHDANKNVSELVSARTGGTAAHYDYSSFGKTLIAAGPLRNRNPFRFSSEYVDDATGLSYYNWRHYDPVHGTWLGRDPIGTDGGVNLYAFCGNDPINFFDSNGAFIYPIMHPSPFFQEDDYDVGKVPEVFDQFGSSAKPFHEEKWFAIRYAGWLKEARRRFTEEINDAVDCSSQSINGSRIMGKSGRVAITPGAPGMIPWEYPAGGNESEFGDELQNNWSTVAVLGQFAIDYVTPVTIQYDGPCFKGKRTFGWETLMYVEDTLGVGKDDGWIGKYFSWAASLRRVKRASWKITGKGECKCCK